MSRAERAKGATGEREIVRILKAHGWPNATRTQDGRHQNQRGDIAGIPDVHIEVRRRENINIWACIDKANREARPGDLPIVAFRRSRDTWKVALELDMFLTLLKDHENS